MQKEEIIKLSQAEVGSFEEILLDIALLEQGACDFFLLRKKAEERFLHCQKTIASLERQENSDPSLLHFWQKIAKSYQQIAQSEEPEDCRTAVIGSEEIDQLNKDLAALFS